MSDGFIICHAPRDDTPDAELLDLYLHLSPDQLRLLERAFVLDLDDTHVPETRAFCERRLRLIRQVLSQP